MMPNALTLLRVSTDHQDVKRQQADAVKNWARHKLHNVGTVTIEGVSGTETLTNTQVLGVLARLTETGVDGVAMSAIDRLFRPAKEFGHMAILDKFVKAGKVLWTNREGYVDPASPEGKAVCFNAAAQASAEWHELRRRSMGGSEQLLLEGLPDCGMVPYGYRYIPKFAEQNARQIIIDDSPSTLKGTSKADVVRMVFQWRREGLSRYTIALRLNEMGIRSVKAQWSRITVKQMLQNRTYIGEFHRRGHVFKVPAIIDPALFEAVQKMKDELAGRWSGRPSSRYLLRGFIWCGRCGKRYFGSAQKNWHGYRCSNFSKHPPAKYYCSPGAVEYSLVDSKAFAAIWSMLKHPKAMYAAAQATVAKRAAATSNKPAAKRMEALRTRIANTVELRQSNLITMAKAREDISAAQTELDKLERETNAAGTVLTLPPVKQVEAFLREITDAPTPTEFKDQRPILEKILDLRFVYDAGNLNITGSIPIPAAEQKGNRCPGAYYTSGLHVPFTLTVEVKAA